MLVHLMKAYNHLIDIFGLQEMSIQKPILLVAYVKKPCLRRRCNLKLASCSSSKVFFFFRLMINKAQC